MNIKLNAYELMTSLSDGQIVEIDARNKWETDIYVNNRHGIATNHLLLSSGKTINLIPLCLPNETLTSADHDS